MTGCTTTKEQRWKGFTREQLGVFGVREGPDGMEVPYFKRDGGFYRAKLFPTNGETRWLGSNKPQIPFGLHRLRLGGKAVILTEGESCTIAAATAFPTVPVIGVPGAASWKSEWRVLFGRFSHVYLSFDGDPGGDGRYLPDKRPYPKGTSLLERVRADLPGARYVMLPDRADTRDVLQLLGIKAYKVLIAAADRMWELEQARNAANRAMHRRREVEIAWERRSAG